MGDRAPLRVNPDPVVFRLRRRRVDILFCGFFLQYFRCLGFKFLEDLFDIKKIGVAQRNFVAPKEVIESLCCTA